MLPRLVEGDFPDSGVLLVDQEAAAHIWALEYSYPHVRISVVIYNELRNPPAGRHIPMKQLLRDDALAIFSAWNAKADKIKY